MADIARLAGIAPGTIYLFAKSKEELFWLALKLAMNKLEPAECRTLSADELRAEFTLDREVFDSASFSIAGKSSPSKPSFGSTGRLSAAPPGRLT